MTNVILQPCANKGSREHYHATIENPVILNEVSHLLTQDEVNSLNNIYPDGRMRVWGVTPGVSGNNISKWERIEIGDVTLLAAQGRVFASAVTTLKFQNKSLASHLWGHDDKGMTWEYMYFISEVYERDIPYLEFNSVVGYEPNYVIQGFNVLSEEKSHRILNHFNLESTIFTPTSTASKYLEEFVGKDLDKESTTIARLEQSTLRRILIGSNLVGKCCICGESYPVNLLVAAHIKKRAVCNNEEKKDISNVAALMCKFGCDDLYEKGYIGVSEGKVVKLHSTTKTESTDTYLRKIVGKQCLKWNPSTEEYFKWHLDQHDLKRVDL
jgi:hypothetical protein